MLLPSYWFSCFSRYDEASYLMCDCIFMNADSITLIINNSKTDQIEMEGRFLSTNLERLLVQKTENLIRYLEVIP